MRVEIPGVEALDIEDRTVPGWEGDPEVGVRLYVPKERCRRPVPGIVTIHGGGFVIGSVESGACRSSPDGGRHRGRGGVGRIPAGA